MNFNPKPIGAMTERDFAVAEVWRFAPEHLSQDETFVVPVRALPVSSLNGCVVATQLRLANGTHRFGLVGNVSLTDPNINIHFVTLTIFASSGQRFDLARYHDIDHSIHGPEALAPFLGLPVASIFPISYDLSSVAVGKTQCIRGVVAAYPDKRLSRGELFSIAVGASEP